MTAIALWLVTTPAAHAGQWVQASCENPGTGTAAGSQGWSGSSAGSPPPGSTVNTDCGPGTPLSAGLLSAFGPAPAGSAETLQYTPPAGSTLAGGTLQISLNSASNGPGLDAVSETTIDSPADTLDDVLISCIPYVSYCPKGTTSSSTAYTGPLALPANEGGGVTVVAQCDGSSGDSCDQNGADGYWAQAEVQSAQLLLTSDASPQGSGFGGSALQRAARGTAHLVFRASVPSGPGVYSVSVAIDGKTVWSGQPDDNGGACVAAGSEGSALVFDSAQPCLSSETVDVPVPTTGLPDGRHELSVTVTDAAGNSSTVLDREISTSNPLATPAPRHGIRTRFYLGWRWDGPVTRLDSTAVRRLPRGGRVTISCAGRRCPALRHDHATGARGVHRLLRMLRGHRFHAGDRVYLEVRVAHRRPERIELRIRNGHQPTARLRRTGRR